jgi:hypothetical protein
MNIPIRQAVVKAADSWKDEQNKIDEESRRYKIERVTFSFDPNWPLLVYG